MFRGLASNVFLGGFTFSYFLKGHLTKWVLDGDPTSRVASHGLECKYAFIPKCNCIHIRSWRAHTHTLAAYTHLHVRSRCVRKRIRIETIYASTEMNSHWPINFLPNGSLCIQHAYISEFSIRQNTYQTPILIPYQFNRTNFLKCSP